MALVIAQSSCSAAGPGDLAHIVDGDRLLPQRVEQQPIDVAAQPLHVGARALGDQPRGGRIDLGAGRRHARPHPALGVRLIDDRTPHSTIVACF